ncbi:EscU/YscU/HrcU family type III secretion system export apparatus switch protein [Granulicella sp. WH15]|uniref:EscU/YscU/HrcU family type III secretion system export apparatus switch protein n=1 Tax=Granulicella sp. WH15 TaxID=2602070 RepID=UPI0013668103|nr:EscU/YscU/HrcU family type III secretion system export apparatus switch protein [Granulicella sp. WH15]QHN03909.1 EscU/YscU/HrcU family type III secretion system export apparatus switch protein [Granulicella sp. WH15]
MPEKGTEQGTAQHRKKSKEKGDSVRSRELLSAAAMMAGVLVLGAVAHHFVATWAMLYQQSLDLASVGEVVGEQRWGSAIRRMLLITLTPVGVVMAASFASALTVGVAQGGGLSIHPNALSLKFERLNPITNLGNLFSLRSATRVFKSLVPAAAMVLFGWAALKKLMLPMPVMSVMRLPTALTTAYSLALDAAWITLIWSGVDYAVEWAAWNKRMKMTKQQVRDEMKETMGNPHTKARIRQAQNNLRRKVKADVSRASVVITNPTHYAVALEFSFDTMQAPTVLAKGRDLHAAEIREAARWAGIPIIENPPLARSLFRTVEPGQSIPFELYATVAGILAFLYRQKVEEKLREEKQRAAAKAAAAAKYPPPTAGIRPGIQPDSQPSQGGGM